MILSSSAGSLKAMSSPTSLKPAYTTRHVPLDAIHDTLSGEDVVPRPGDLVVATVTELGQHKRIELRDGRRAHLFPGDRVLVAYGNRYAPDQFEAVVPARLEPCCLVAAGGVAAKVLCRHESMSEATAIVPVGLAVDARGRRLNLADFAPPAAGVAARPPRVLAVAGSSMNAGKTTTAASLVHGLCRAGVRVGAAKVTGTGAGGDLWQLADAGAHPVLDFGDAGVASTSLLEPTRVEAICVDLVARLALAGAEVAVIEVADGLLQAETAALLRSASFRELVDGVLFAASDPLGACAGAAWLEDVELPLVAISGLVSASPLAAREVAAAVGHAVLNVGALTDPQAAQAVLRGDAQGAVACAEALAVDQPEAAEGSAPGDVAVAAPVGGEPGAVLAAAPTDRDRLAA
jgi:hypothetical protein